ncbi:phBC6A51 family helix-turn-helix protein [Peribacillus sp. JNUCC 23]
MMEEKVLTNQQEAAAQLIADGELEKKVIAEKVGVARQTLYNWLKDENFTMRVDSLRHEFESFGKDLLTSKFTWAVNGYLDLITTTKNDRVKAEGYRYVIDRKLGKPTQHVRDESQKDNNGVDEETIDNEFEELVNEDK